MFRGFTAKRRTGGVMAKRKSNVIKFPQPIDPLLEKIDRLTMKDLRRDLAAAEAGAAGDVEFLFLSIKRRLRDRDAIRREAIAKYVRVRAKARDFRSV
jgi:hypothetical protein